MKDLLNTNTTNILELLGNGKSYKIPKFQRDYSWSEENWEDLWNDLMIIEGNDNFHYMGSILLQSTNEDDTYIIVDGQQRITTIMLMIIGIKKILTEFIEKGINPEQNKERIDSIERKYIGEKTLSGLHFKNKLTLNKNNNLFFQDKLLRLIKPNNTAKLRDSEKLLLNGYNYFYEKLKEKFKNDDGFKISEFLEKRLSKKLILIKINVDNDLDAYTVFETLNARGVELTTTDLLKNYFFSILGENAESGYLEERWQNIVDNVGLKTFPTFLRFYLNSKQNLVRKEQLFKLIKKDILRPEDVINLLDTLEKKAELFRAIKNPYDEFWNEYSHKSNICSSLEEIKLFEVTQFIPLIFSVNEKYPEILHKVLNICSVIAFRYNIIAKRNPNDMEKAYNTVAKLVYNGEINNEKQIFNNLKNIYVNDQDFKNLFSSKEISTKRAKKLVKYILIKLENHLSGAKYDIDDTTITIEHILPENYSEDRNNLFEGDADNYVYRLGNYSLLEQKLNKKCSTENFDFKKQIYTQSNFKIFKKLLNNEVRNIKTITVNQNNYSDYATGIWKIDY